MTVRQAPASIRSTMTAKDNDDSAAKPGLHPRNRHRLGYDFASLTAAVPELVRHLVVTPAGQPSIDFADPAAVKMLNRALLLTDYGVHGWDIPANYLCPPIPGRADMLHCLADLLAEGNAGVTPRGERIWALDIGVGANAVSPLIGHAEYGWSFVGVDTDPLALANVKRIVAANPGLARAIKLRQQTVTDNILAGL
ncbi:MAG TPA: RlmF-related methyltransferase, partial [Azospira sp.]|nr:RlmF-related methyltransferase [Azospira sp.]